MYDTDNAGFLPLSKLEHHWLPVRHEIKPLTYCGNHLFLAIVLIQVCYSLQTVMF